MKEQKYQTLIKWLVVLVLIGLSCFFYAIYQSNSKTNVDAKQPQTPNKPIHKNDDDDINKPVIPYYNSFPKYAINYNEKFLIQNIGGTQDDELIKIHNFDDNILLILKTSSNGYDFNASNTMLAFAILDNELTLKKTITIPQTFSNNNSENYLFSKMTPNKFLLATTNNQNTFIYIYNKKLELEDRICIGKKANNILMHYKQNKVICICQYENELKCKEIQFENNKNIYIDKFTRKNIQGDLHKYLYCLTDVNCTIISNTKNTQILKFNQNTMLTNDIILLKGSLLNVIPIFSKEKSMIITTCFENNICAYVLNNSLEIKEEKTIKRNAKNVQLLSINNGYLAYNLETNFVDILDNNLDTIIENILLNEDIKNTMEIITIRYEYYILAQNESETCIYKLTDNLHLKHIGAFLPSSGKVFFKLIDNHLTAFFTSNECDNEYVHQYGSSDTFCISYFN